MLTRKQHELLVFIQSRLAETGISPSFEEMKAALDLKSKSGIHRLISALEQRQFIRRLPHRARALEVLRGPEASLGAKRLPPASVDRALSMASPSSVPVPHAANGNDILNLPLHGRIAAGVPIEAIEGHSDLAVPAALLGPGEHYALEVAGDSMVEAGILDGDFALIRRTDAAREGEIVVALIDDHDATLKYFRRENGQIRLDPANATYQPQRYHPAQVRIQGRLAGLLRRY